MALSRLERGIKQLLSDTFNVAIPNVTFRNVSVSRSRRFNVNWPIIASTKLVIPFNIDAGRAGTSFIIHKVLRTDEV